MVEVSRELDGLINDAYIPSSVERKKAMLMYFFVGIMAALAKERLSVYEFFHLKQAIGRWTIFFLGMVFGLVFLFIFLFAWFFLVIPFFFLLCFLVIWIIFAKQAWEGKYVIDENKIVLPLFASLGGWVVSIFELEVASEDSVTQEQAE